MRGKTLSQEELALAKSWYDEQVSDREGGQVAFTTFHQSYGYEEFIEGIRPSVVTDDDPEGPAPGISYGYEDGIFKSFCKRAARPITTEAARDFGFNADPTVWKVSLGGAGDNPVRSECLTSGHIRIGWDEYGADIKEDTDFSAHGGKNVLTPFVDRMRKGDIVPYTKEPFSVPANVSIIGTMNTANRSIALMDTALRRRFDFVEAMPDPTLLEGLDVEGVDVARMLSAMNDRIELLYDREHTLGHG